MRAKPVFHTQTPLMRGLVSLFARLEQSLSLRQALDVYLAGGMAVHLYTAARVTTDVDAEFAGRVLIPADLAVDVDRGDGTSTVLHFDTNYNASFALMHEDYRDDAIAIDLGLQHIRLHVLSPVDLAVSKIARLAEHDRADILALVHAGLTTADEIEARATSAIGGYIGGLEMLRANLREAVTLARTTSEGQA